MNKKRIIIDFDGTICGFEFPECGPPEPRVREALLELSAMGFEIVIHSCRTGSYWEGKRDGPNRKHHYEMIINFMYKHDLYYDDIIMDENMDKPIAEFYIDDRGVSYKGNWNDVVNEIKSRKEN